MHTQMIENVGQEYNGFAFDGKNNSEQKANQCESVLQQNWCCTLF